MITLTCKSYRARSIGETVVLEIDDAQPSNLLPQLLTKTDVATRLAISIRKVETIAAEGRLPIVRVDGCVRFREDDVLRFLNESQNPTLRAIITPIPARTRVAG
jgi:excisionase family DNA binding protein